jgi:hypothetical protein
MRKEDIIVGFAFAFGLFPQSNRSYVPDFFSSTSLDLSQKKIHFQMTA